MPASELDELATFLVHVLKRLLYAFDCVDGFGPEVEDGSPQAALYFDAIYNYTAQLFLLDKGSEPMGGSAYPALCAFGLGELLAPVRALLDEPIGDTTFGEAVRLFRNNGIVHSTHAATDIDRVAELIDIDVATHRVRWLALLQSLREVVAQLAVDVANSSGRPLEDFGISAGGRLSN